MTVKRAPLPGAKGKTKAQTKRRRRRTPPQYKKFGLEVQEAKRDLTIPLLQVDIEEAEKVRTDDVNAEENFLGCVIAQATTRACGAERVAIMRETAYVAFPGEDHVKRYLIDKGSRRVLEAWDRGEHIVEGVELRLTPPSPKRSRAYLAKYMRDYNQTPHGTQRRKKNLTNIKRRRPDPLHNIVRNGNLVRWS